MSEAREIAREQIAWWKSLEWGFKDAAAAVGMRQEALRWRDVEDFLVSTWAALDAHLFAKAWAGAA